MKVAYLTGNTGPEGLVFGELPPPMPGAGELLIKVHATAITPTELQWFPTFKTRSGEPRPFPIVLSHEFSGLVAALDIAAYMNDLRLNSVGNSFVSNTLRLYS
jgi:NADPH:quinone reductase-like Zn-dependent oxidoreductase